MYFLSDEGKEMNVSNGGILYSSGELIVLISTLFWVVSIISCDFAVKRGCNGISFTTIGFMVSTVCSLIVALIFESHFFVYPYTIIFKSWDMILLVGITEAISFILGTLGQMYCSPSQASIIFALEGVFAAVGAYFFLGEILTPTELFGCFLMLSAAVFCSFESELDLNNDNSNQNTDDHDKAMIESNFISNLKSSDPLISNALPNYSVIDIHDINSKS
jgi:drug/metabolite transporter (DMT)-like permease